MSEDTFESNGFNRWLAITTAVILLRALSVSQQADNTLSFIPKTELKGKEV